MNINGQKLSELTIDESQEFDNKQPKGKLWAGLILAGVIGIGTYFYLDSESLENKKQDLVQSSNIDPQRRKEAPLTNVKPGVLSSDYDNSQSDITASGYVVAKKKTTVSSSVAGVVRYVHINEGENVVKGQLLAELDNDVAKVRVESALGDVETARLNLIEANLRLSKLQMDLSRLETLIEKRLVSDADYKQAALEFEMQANQVETAKQRMKLFSSNLRLTQIELAQTEIRAPFDGVVTEINAQPGEIVSPISGGGGHIRTGICTIVDLNSLVVEVDINEQHLEHINKYHHARIQLDAYSQLDYSGEVDYIVPIIDKLKGSIKVRIAHTDFDERVLPGMGVQVWINKSKGTIARQEIQK